jgi:hypothetical protein
MTPSVAEWNQLIKVKPSTPGQNSSLQINLESIVEDTMI